MPNNQNWDAEKEPPANPEEPAIEEWRIHAVANRLEESLRIKARPEFESELRNRLLTSFEQPYKPGSKLKTHGLWNFGLLPIWRAVPGMLLLGVVILALTAVALVSLDTGEADKGDNSTRTPVLNSRQEKSMYIGFSRTAKMEIAEVNFEPVITGKDADEFELQWQRSNRKNSLVSANSSNPKTINSNGYEKGPNKREIFIL